MLQSERTRWTSGAGQWGGPVEIVSRPALLVASPRRTGLQPRLEEGSFSSPGWRGWRGWSVKPKGRVARGPGFRAVRDYDPEPIAREI